MKRKNLGIEELVISPDGSAPGIAFGAADRDFLNDFDRKYPVGSVGTTMPASKVHNPPRQLPEFLSIIQRQTQNDYFEKLGSVGEKLESQKSVRYAFVGPNGEGSIDDYPEDKPLIIYAGIHARSWDDYPAKYLSAKLLRKHVSRTRGEDLGVLVLPNNGVMQSSYRFSSAERKKVADGDLSPLAERDIELLRALGLEDRKLLLYGASFGASRILALGSLAAKTGTLPNIESVVVSAPADARRYNMFGGIVLRALFASQKKHLRPEFNSLGIESISHFENTKPGIGNRLKFELGLIMYTLGGNLTPTNNAINRYFTRNSHAKTLSELRKGVNAPVGIVHLDNDPMSNIEEINAGVDALSDDAKHHTHLLRATGNHVRGSMSFVLGKSCAIIRHLRAQK